MTDWLSRLERVRGGFDAAARAQGVRVLGIAFPDDEILMEQISGLPGAIVLDATAPDLLADLRKHAFNDPVAQPAALRLAHTAVERGVSLRMKNALAFAYAYQRFALYVAAHHRDVDGICIVVHNLWFLHEMVRDVLERAGGPERNPEASDEQRTELESYRQGLNWVAECARIDAKAAATTVQRIVEEWADASDAEILPLLHALHRLGSIAGDSRRRDALARIQSLSSATRSWEVLIQVAAEEIAQMNMIDVLLAADLLPVEAAADGSDASGAWALYQNVRIHLPDAAADKVLMSYANAVRHLGYLRLAATTAGGPFGHQLSYALSSFLQPIGRDLVFLRRRLGHEEEALSVAEFVLARSMVDWMARHHPNRRVPREFRAAVAPLQGSMNCVEVANLGELAAVASQGTPLLYFLAQPDGYAVWLVRTDSSVVASHVDDPAPALSPVFRTLPYLSDSGRGDGARQVSLTPRRGRRDLLDRYLAAAYRALFPEEITEALSDQGERLVIIADPRLDAVPFAALRTGRGTYLVEEREILQGPSVTALLLLASSSSLASLYRARAHLPPPDLVLARSRFDESYDVRLGATPRTVKLRPLPGAELEGREVARLLGTELLLDSAATPEALLRLGEGARVIHVATHGFLDESSPEDSFLALSGQKLTAGFLYQFDQGLHVGLVVLSACQTALGGAHPDSTIGLANAFLIAGARGVVSSLWQIPDEMTAQLMGRFYRHLHTGASVASGLRAAQLEALSDPAMHDPYVWGAFRVTGLGGFDDNHSARPEM